MRNDTTLRLSNLYNLFHSHAIRRHTYQTFFIFLFFFLIYNATNKYNVQHNNYTWQAQLKRHEGWCLSRSPKPTYKLRNEICLHSRISKLLKLESFGPTLHFGHQIIRNIWRSVRASSSWDIRSRSSIHGFCNKILNLQKTNKNT